MKQDLSGRIIEIDYETHRAIVRYEGNHPEVGTSVYLTPTEPAVGEPDAITQRILDTMKGHAAPAVGAPVADSIIAGALFDLMGDLTSGEIRYRFSSYDEAGPAVKALEKFAAKRGLRLDDANVSGWREAIAPPAASLREQQDAARYRWLRDNYMPPDNDQWGALDSAMASGGIALDSVIDAQRLGRENESGNV